MKVQREGASKNGTAQHITLKRVVFFLCLWISVSDAGFTEIPTPPENVTVGQVIVFRCRHASADTISWMFDSSLIGSNPPSGITVDYTRDMDDNLVYTLRVVALVQYNRTVIECVASVLNATTQLYDHKTTPPIVLIIKDSARHLANACGSTFLESPMSQTVPEGAEVQFKCSHQSSNHLLWEIDGGSISNGPSIDFHATVSTTISMNSRSIQVLKFNARLRDRPTTVVCVAVFTNGCQQQRTKQALLFVQGSLKPVSSVVRQQLGNQVYLSYSWDPPPSLDLTDIEPDVAYCVEIYNITCGCTDLLHSECDLTLPVFVGDGLDPSYVYQISVTPRINALRTSNGTRFSRREDFVRVQLYPLSFVKHTDSKVFVEIGSYLSNNIPMERSTKAQARLYSLNIKSLDYPNESMSVNISEHNLTTHVLLPVRQRWTCTVFAYACWQHPVSRATEISTHEVQNVSVTSPQPGEIRVTGELIDGTTATGVLAVISNDSENFYLFVPREGNKLLVENSTLGLVGGQYAISVFTVMKDGLSFQRVATSPMVVSVKTGGKVEQSFPIQYSLQSNSTGVCITCDFLNSSATDCVAVVHQQISRFNSSGLMNIESSHKFTRSGDTASGCIEGVNLEDYQVGVIGARLRPVHIDLNTPSTTCVGCILGVIAAIVAVTVLVAIMAAVTIRAFTKKRQTIHQPLDTRETIVYSEQMKVFVTSGNDNIRAQKALMANPQVRTTAVDRCLEDSGHIGEIICVDSNSPFRQRFSPRSFPQLAAQREATNGALSLPSPDSLQESNLGLVSMQHTFENGYQARDIGYEVNIIQTPTEAIS